MYEKHKGLVPGELYSYANLNLNYKSDKQDLHRYNLHWYNPIP